MPQNWDSDREVAAVPGKDESVTDESLDACSEPNWASAAALVERDFDGKLADVVKEETPATAPVSLITSVEQQAPGV